MAVSRALRRLLRVLETEEEQRRLELESGLGDLARLKRAREAAGRRDCSGRGLVSGSVHSGEVRDRLAGLEETRTAQRITAALKPRIAAAETAAAELRKGYLAKRTERLQVETLLEKTIAREEAEAEKRSQRTLDERFLSEFQSKAKVRKTNAASGAVDVRSETDEDEEKFGCCS